MINLKKSLVLSFILCAVVFSVTAQDKTSVNSVNENQSSIEETLKIEDVEVEDQVIEDKKNGPSAFAVVMRMILVLLIVVGLIYLVFHFIKKKTNYVKNEDDYLRKVAYINIAPGKTVEVVTLLDKGYLIGVTEDNITLLGEINDDELVKAMNLSSDKKNNTKKPSTFSEVLDMFLVKKGKKQKNVFEDEEIKVDNLIKNNNLEE